VLPKFTSYKKVLVKLKTQYKLREQLEGSSTVVHCTLTFSTRIRIWPSTFLVQDNGIRKKLLHAFNIPAYPKYINAPAGYTFTLVFESIDKLCVLFDLFEDIPQNGGFHIEKMIRNKTGVYRVEI
jgi:hypothetical protein